VRHETQIWKSHFNIQAKGVNLMKKVFIATLLVLSTVTFTIAQLRIGLSGAYSIPSNSNYKGGIAVGVQIGYIIIDNLSVEFGGMTYKYTVDGSREGLSKGSLSLVPFEFTLQGRLPLSGKKIVPYIMVGFGYEKNKFSIDSQVTAPWNNAGISIEEKVENSMTYHTGIGVDFFLIKKLFANMNVKYLMAETEGSWRQTDTGTGASLSGSLNNLKFGAILISLGLKYSFCGGTR
jgi:outer membrane protein W